MITIHYSPGFDNGVYLKNKNYFGNIYLGNEGLLNYLELILGLTGRYPSDTTRQRKYREALQFVSSNNMFFSESFKNDPVKVAAQLLLWRDSLVIGGIDFDNKDTPERISNLADVESKFKENGYFNYAGKADRWRKIFEKIPNAFVKQTELKIYLSNELLPKWLSKTIERVNENQNIEVEFLKSESNNIADCESDLYKVQDVVYSFIENRKINPVKLKADSSVRIIEVTDSYEGNRWVQQYLKKNQNIEKVVVNKNFESILSLYQREDKMPHGKIATASSRLPIFQIINLLPSLIWKPINIEKIWEFLKLPVTPVNSHLSSIMADLISDVPGIGSEKWHERISKYKEWFKNKEDFDDKELKKNLEQLEFWVNDTRVKVEDYNNARNRAVEMINRLLSWTNKRMRIVKDEAFKLQFGAFLNTLEELNISIKKLPENIEFTELLFSQLIEEVSYYSDFDISKEQAGSVVQVISSINILDTPNEIIYFDENNESEAHDYWFPEEIEWFNKNKILIPTQNEELALSFYEDILVTLKAIKRLIIIRPVSDAGKKVEKGNFLKFLDGMIKDVEKIYYKEDSFNHVLKTDRITDFINLNAPKLYWDIGQNNIANRDKESYSSLEKLFYYPYAYVLSYIAKIKPAYHGPVSEEIRIMGNLAHRVVELIAKEFEGELVNIDDNKIQTFISENFEELLKKEGATFLLLHMKKNKEEYKNILEKSLINFFDLCRKNKWTKITVEEELEGELDKGLGLSAFVDVVLQKDNPKSKAVVDLKFFKSKKNEEAIKSNRDLQLTIYSKLVQSVDDFSYSGAGYYFVRDQILMAKNKNIFDEAEVVGEDNTDKTDSLWNKMKATAKFRFEEIKSGKIEVADGMTLNGDELDYLQNKDLLELPGTKKKNTTTKEYYLAEKEPMRYNDYVNLLEVK